MFRKYQIKDIIFLAVLAAVTTLFGGLAMPVMSSRLFGIQTLVTCLFYTLFCAIGLKRVAKPGALTLFGLFTGFPLLFMAPVMFFDNFLAALLAEAVVLLVFRGYRKHAAVVTAGALWMALTVPLSLPFSLWVNSWSQKGASSFANFQSTPVWQSALVFCGVVVLSVCGALLGVKIAKELQKAGKLRGDAEDSDA